MKIILDEKVIDKTSEQEKPCPFCGGFGFFVNKRCFLDVRYNEEGRMVDVEICKVDNGGAVFCRNCKKQTGSQSTCSNEIWWSASERAERLNADN